MAQHPGSDGSGAGRLGRLAAGALALVAGAGWLVLALAMSPVGEAVRDALLDGDSASCSSSAAEWGQLALAGVGGVTALAFAVRLGRRRRAWPLLAAFLLLLVAWFALGSGADCAFSGDD